MPWAWIEQTDQDALILAPLACAGRGGLMVLLRGTSTGAVGSFLAAYGGFMPVRARPPVGIAQIDTDLLKSLRPTRVPIEVVRDRHPASFFISLACPVAFSAMSLLPDECGQEQTWCAGADGSRFVLTAVDGEVRAAADGPLWTHIEEAFLLWHELDKPPRQYFGISVEPGRQWVWLDDPDHERWRLPV